MRFELLKKMNGVNDMFHYSEYLIDSTDATAPYQDSYTSKNWPQFVFENGIQEIIGIKILEAEIPYSFYTVYSPQNTFTVTESGTDYLVTIIPGNYTSASLIPELIRALGEATSYAWNVTYNNQTGKFTFSTTPTKTFTFTFPSGILKNTIGFNSGVTQPTDSLTAPNIAQITGANYILVNSESLGRSAKLYLPINDQQNRGGIGAELAKIPINVNPFEVITWQDPAPMFFFATDGLRILQNVDFYITHGTDANPINFNGLSFSLKVGILQRNKDLVNDVFGAKRIRSY